jgi:hypothetical protein
MTGRALVHSNVFPATGPPLLLALLVIAANVGSATAQTFACASAAYSRCLAASGGGTGVPHEQLQLSSRHYYFPSAVEYNPAGGSNNQNEDEDGNDLFDPAEDRVWCGGVCEKPSGEMCPPGHYGNTRGTDCSKCTEGKFKASFNSDSSCDDCPAGKFQLFVRQDACVDCSAGMYSSSSGEELCTFCDSGKFSTTTGASSSSVCRTCYEGTFSCANDLTGECSSRTGGVARSPVDLGLSWPAGSPVRAAGDHCTLCPAGYYQDSQGQRECKACPAGQTSASPRFVGTSTTGGSLNSMDNEGRVIGGMDCAVVLATKSSGSARSTITGTVGTMALALCASTFL